MTPASTDSSTSGSTRTTVAAQTESSSSDAPPGRPAPPVWRKNEAHNFVWLVVHHVLLRIGWIFKTESIIMPAFMSHIGGGPWLLGWLPVVQRFGLSVPPLLYARRLTVMPKKKYAVVLTSLGMALPFALLSYLWFQTEWRGSVAGTAWAPYGFLVVYAVFFTLTGMNQLGEHSLSAKLVRVNRRGRLFAAGVMIGSPIAILCALTVLTQWLRLPDGGFGWIFAMVALVFFLSATAAVLLREERDRHTEESTGVAQKFHLAIESIRQTPDRRGLALLALLCSANFMLFPHYQALGRERFGLGLTSLAVWVALQNGATALYGIFAGPLADRLGNRAALRFCVFGLAFGPLIAGLLSLLPVEIGKQGFWMVFMAIGFTPVTIRFITNYAIELAPGADEARYVSAIGVCMALPVIVGSPLVGLLVAAVGAPPVMFGGWLVLLIAALQTYRLNEPRHTQPTPPPETSDPATPTLAPSS